MIFHTVNEGLCNVCIFQQKTPDDDFIIDKHPQYPNIIIGAGFTGDALPCPSLHVNFYLLQVMALSWPQWLVRS